MNNSKTDTGLILVTVIISIICIVLIVYNRHQINILSLAPIQPTTVALPSSPPTPMPTPVPRISKIIASQINPDNSYILKLKMIPEQNLTAFTLLYAKASDSTGTQLYASIPMLDTNWSIPFNTWSPDNKYIFIQEDKAKTRDYIIFPVASADPIEPIRLSRLFYNQYPDHVLREVTGWAGASLLILNTQTKNGETGPSFWFHPATKAFTQLSTRF